MKRIIFILLLFSCTVVQAQINNLQRPFAGFDRAVKVDNIAFIDSADVGGFFITKDSSGNPVDNLNIFPTKDPAIRWVRVVNSSVSVITTESTTYLFEDSTNTPPTVFPPDVDTTYWMVGGAPTGIFVGHDFDVAVYVNGVFDVFIDPNINDWGLTLDDNFWHQYNGSTWPRRNPPDWTTSGNFNGGIMGSLVPQSVFLRYNNVSRIVLQGNGTRFPGLSGTDMGIMGLNATGLSRRINLDTNSVYVDDDDTLRIVGSGTLQTAYNNSIAAADNPLIDANGGVFNIDDANNILLYATPHAPNSFASNELSTRDAGAQRYSGFSSTYGVSSGDTSMIAGMYATNTLTQIGNIFNLTDTSAALEQFWGTGVSSDNTIQQFSHPPPIVDLKYYIPISVTYNGGSRILSDNSGNIDLGTIGGGSGGDGNIWYREDSLLASDRTVGLNGNTLEFAGASSLLLNPVAGSEGLTAGTVDGTGNSNLYIRSNTDDGYGFGIDASNGTNGVSIAGDAATNSITHTAGLHTIIGTVSIPNGTSANGVTITAGTNSGFVESAELDNAFGLRLKYGNTDVGGGMRRNIGNNLGELRIYSDSTVNNGYITFYTKGDRAAIIDSAGNVGIGTTGVPTNKVEIAKSMSGGSNDGFYMQMTNPSDSKTLKAGIFYLTGYGSLPGIWMNQASPSVSNYTLMTDITGDNLFNTTSVQRFRVSNADKLTINSTDATLIANLTTTGNVNVGSAPAASAMLTVTSTTKGFLPPRMTATQASAISSPAEGLLVYVTDTNGTFTSKGWWGWSGAAWEKLNN